VRLRPLLVDAAVTLVIAWVGVALSARAGAWQSSVRALDPLGYALILGAALPLAVRRVWPLVTLALTTAAISLYLVVGYPYGPIFLAMFIAVLNVALRLPARPATIACAVALVVLQLHIPILAAGRVGAGAWAGLVPGSAWVVVPFAIGRVVRLGREAAARTRAEEVERHGYEERLRVAQEVHDIVGHGLAAIHLQAEIALHVLAKQPAQAETALAAISRTSKEALDELRATLDVVRQRNGAVPDPPGPGLARLDDLVARMSGTGVPVTVTVEGSPRELPPGVDLAAYRIVQEALTNVLRHAVSATAAVRLGYAPSEVTVEVTDTGRGTPTGSDGGSGIAGMRERVGALGGVFEAGPRVGGGFRVYARLPANQPGAAS
jgi:signal transduction histidine kinase